MRPRWQALAHAGAALLAFTLLYCAFFSPVLWTGMLLAPFALRSHGAAQAAHGLVRTSRRAASAAASALPQNERQGLAAVAAWLAPTPANEATKIADEIRKDPDSFALFAGFHTEQERRAAHRA